MDEQESAVAGTVDDAPCTQCAETKALPHYDLHETVIKTFGLATLTAFAVFGLYMTRNAFTITFLALCCGASASWASYWFWRNGFGPRFDITLDVNGDVHAHRCEQTIGSSWVAEPCWYWNGQSDGQGAAVQRDASQPMLRVSLGFIPRCEVFALTDCWPNLTRNRDALRIGDKQGGALELPIIANHPISASQPVAQQLDHGLVRELMRTMDAMSAREVIARGNTAREAEQQQLREQSATS